MQSMSKTRRFARSIFPVALLVISGTKTQTHIFGQAFSTNLHSINPSNRSQRVGSTEYLSTLAMSSTSSTSIPTWDDLKSRASETPVGKALDDDVRKRIAGTGSPHVHSKIRIFDGEEKPTYTLFRDHAGWCP